MNLDMFLKMNKAEAINEVECIETISDRIEMNMEDGEFEEAIKNLDDIKRSMRSLQHMKDNKEKADKTINLSIEIKGEQETLRILERLMRNE